MRSLLECLLCLTLILIGILFFSIPNMILPIR